MKKTKFSKLLVLLLVVCMTVSMLVLTACANDNNVPNEPNKTEKDTQLVKNGDFTFNTGSDYPRVPTAWGGSIGGSGQWQPEGGMDNLKVGVINVGKDYDANKNKWGALNNPGKHEGAKDDNILMLYSKMPSSYSYTCDSFTINPNKYYKLSFYVMTDANITGVKNSDGVIENHGAYINVNGGNVNGNWIDIKTNGEWQKFEMYIEGGTSSTNSLKITFGLGYGDKTDKHLTQGYAFFDDVVLEELVDIDNGLSAKQQYDAAKVYYTPQASTENYEHKDSFKFSNANFSNYNRFYTSIPSYPYGWSDGVGGVDDDRANNIPSDERPSVTKGIIDLSPANLEKNKSSYGLETIPSNLQRTNSDNYALMLYTNKNYSVNYVASSNITIEKGKIYRIGVWARTLNTVKDVVTRGTIMLYNDNEEYRISFDNKNIYFTDPISKTAIEVPLSNPDSWNEISFYIRGNNTHDVNYKLMLALGMDGKSKQENWSCGHVFFDDINIKSTKVDSKVPETSYADGWEKVNTGELKDNYNALSSHIDLNKKNSENILANDVTNGNFENGTKVEKGQTLPNKFSLIDKVTDVSFNGKIDVVNAKANNIELPFEVIYKFGSTADTSKVATNVLQITSKDGTTIGIKHDDKFTVKMNKQYRLAFWVKTENIDTTSGMFFRLNILDKEDKVVDTKELRANSKDIAKEADNYENGWQEVVFYISGDNSDDINFNIEMQYGAGTLFENKLAKGTAYIYNVNLQQIDKSAFTNASTSSIVTKVDLAANSTSSNEKIANGNFNKFVTSSSSFDNDGRLDKFGTPQSWSVSNDNIPKEVLTYSESVDGKEVIKDKKVSRGIVDIADEDILKTMLKNELGAGYDSSIIQKILNLNDASKNRYALGIYSKDSIINTYKSNYINLDANSYYSISIRVFTGLNAKATIKLSSSSPHEEGNDTFSSKTSVDGWTEYVFFVKTGLTSASVNLDLSIGSLEDYLIDKKSNPDTKVGLSSGLVLFDYATLTTHTKDTYELAKKEFGIPENNQLEIKFNTDGFASDSYERNKLNSINGWSTNNNTLNQDISGGKAPILAGVLDWSRYEEKDIWKYDTAGETASDKIISYQTSKKTVVDNAKAKAKEYEVANPGVSFGNSVLMIDNMIPAGFTVSNSSGKELASNKYFKISILVYSDIKANDKNEGLTLSLKISDKDNGTVKIENIQSTNGWVEYSFYVKNVNEIKDTKLSATLTMQLGKTVTVNKKDTLNAVEGMVFADNFNIVETTKEVYDAALNDTLDNTATIEFIPEKEIDPNKDNSEQPAQKNEVNWQMLSWAIPTIILAVMLLVVLGVFLYKKYSGPKTHKHFKGDKKNKAKKAEVHNSDDSKFED